MTASANSSKWGRGQPRGKKTFDRENACASDCYQSGKTKGRDVGEQERVFIVHLLGSTN